MMTFRHPLDFLLPGLSRRLFFIFLALTLAGFAIFQVLDRPLRTAAAPSGIVSFEFSGTVENAQAMMNSWDASALLNNAFGLGFDFLFMPVYATALSLGVLLAVDRRKGRWGMLGKTLGWGAFAAALFDSVENIALFSILKGNIVAPFPQVAAGCASVKFGLILLGLAYSLIGWILPEKRH